MTTDTADIRSGTEPIDRTASRVAQQAGQTMEKQASLTMDRAAQTIDQVATAVRQAGDGLREQQPQIATFADTAATQVEQVGRYLREHEPQEVLGGIESWARRQPALAVGGALAIGLIVGRFIRSASPPRQESSWAGASTGYGYATDLARRGANGSYAGSTADSGYPFQGSATLGATDASIAGHFGEDDVTLGDPDATIAAARGDR